MKKALISLLPLLVASFIVVCPFSAAAQNREKFVISARAGGVNAVTGRAAMRAGGNGDWQQLTTREDLEKGDVVRTGLDGRVEMLLNPGSYLRIGENSEVELTDNSLENLEVRLLRGTAIVEVTGTDDTELLINITTPHTRMAIVRRGLYRVNVVPGDATELIVRKGRVMLDRTHTKIKGGDKVVFSENSFSVAKLKKEDKTRDNLEAWSKDRAETLARANSSLSRRDINLLLRRPATIIGWTVLSAVPDVGSTYLSVGSTPSFHSRTAGVRLTAICTRPHFSAAIAAVVVFRVSLRPARMVGTVETEQVMVEVLEQEAALVEAPLIRRPQPTCRRAQCQKAHGLAMFPRRVRAVRTGQIDPK